MSGEYYYQRVCDALGVAADPSKTYHLDCPQCGKGKKHFAFSGRWALCLRCGYRPTFKQLLSDLGGEATVVLEPRPRKPSAWKAQANSLVAQFASHPRLISLWQSYKPLSEQVIWAYKLGVGVFPGLWFSDSPGRAPDFVDRTGGPHWKCDHQRLILPLLVAGEVVGFRCRALECNCPKWLSPAGSRLTLYNGGRLASPNLDNYLGDSFLPAPPERVLFIVENPLDALLIEQNWGHWAVATLGVSIWRPAWTRAVLGLEIPTLVAYDNDAPGNTTDPEILCQWQESHPGIAPPLNGLKLARNLERARIRTRLYRWPNGLPRGTDIGDLMGKKRKSSQTQRLAFWFIRNIIGREIKPEDFRGMHMKHAKLLLARYSVSEICGCLEAVRDGLFGDFKHDYMTVIENLEPPLIAQYREYLTTPPPVYLEAETAEWQARQAREYKEVEEDPTEVAAQEG